MVQYFMKNYVLEAIPMTSFIMYNLEKRVETETDSLCLGELLINCKIINCNYKSINNI